MTKAELDKKISDINNESASTEEKQRRIKILNDTYSNNQTRLADEAKTKQLNRRRNIKKPTAKGLYGQPGGNG